MLLFDVTRLFDGHCKRLTHGNEEKLRFIQNHERRYVVLNNLCQQIVGYETRFKGKGNIADRERIISSVASMFVNMALNLRDLQNQSIGTKGVKSDETKRNDAMEEISQFVKEIDRSID